ncbi:dihydrofolate reductase family protein [Spirochaeta isovalerica]|uniref:Dihydrofolate reductase n=1 Tax=Spirochaeta isovalerica TaxID=150 RepID=A0A841R4H1_9SPIO|nr:dihydrofolate reductase family protein [Spirochaeta isovalerica]MBB6480024.1 dihydrofolate reductase [Spirochaeta isovalerica]
MKSIVYIAASLDGYIADRNNNLDWLETISNPDNIDTGFSDFLGRVDAIVMGRNTFEKVLSFGIDWPYPVPVFVCSTMLKEVPDELKSSVRIISGSPGEILSRLEKEGFTNLYIDGGRTIQNFLADDLIDEMIITTIPVLLGGGIPLFGELDNQLDFQLVSSEILLGQMVSSRFMRKPLQDQ